MGAKGPTARQKRRSLIEELTNSVPPKQSNRTVGRRIRKRRLKVGLSLEEASFAGCNRHHLSMIETGKFGPSERVVLILSLILWVRPRYLKYGRGPVVLSREVARDILLDLGVKEEKVNLQLNRAWKNFTLRNQ
jgi:transcriptional regulator with XRE-family HTH domain